MSVVVIEDVTLAKGEGLLIEAEVVASLSAGMMLAEEGVRAPTEVL